MIAADYPHRIEFVCSQCLFAIHSEDDGPIPWCPRCRIKLTPDDLAVPQPRVTPAQARATAATKGKPTQRSRAKVNAA